MKITVFAKKRNTKEGKVFYTYLTKLAKKDGSEVTTAVKFKDDNKPNSFPVNLIVSKQDCNFNTKNVVNEATGEVYQNNTLWINRWVEGEPYIDHSMDDFMDDGVDADTGHDIEI